MITIKQCFLLLIEKIGFPLLLKITSQRMKTNLCPVYFIGKTKSKSKMLISIDKCYNILKTPDVEEECKKVEKHVKGIVFINKVHTTWTKSGYIIIKWDENHLTNYLYLLGVLVWFSSCMEMSRSKDSLKLNFTARQFNFNKMFVFFQKVNDDTSLIENYFKETYYNYEKDTKVTERNGTADRGRSSN